MQFKREIMKKSIAVAALLAASLSVPALPVQAATLADWVNENSNCLVFGVLKRECWVAADEAADDVVLSYRDAAQDRGWNTGWWRDCDLAEPGSRTLLVCK
jgi:hypothetical protein